MPLSTSSGPREERSTGRSEASTTAVTRPSIALTATIRSVSHTLAQTVEPTHSSSFSRSTGRPSRVTSSEPIGEKSSDRRRVIVAEPSEVASVSSSNRQTPQPSPS